MMQFTVEESNLIAMYPHNSRQEMLEGLHQAVIYIKEQEVEELVQHVIAKAEKMSDEEFRHEVFVLEEE